MRILLSWVLAFFFSFGISPYRVDASEGLDDVVKLVKSGVGEEILLAYVNASTVAYDLSVDEILYLNDLGVSSKVISEIIGHGKALREIAVESPERANSQAVAEELKTVEPPYATESVLRHNELIRSTQEGSITEELLPARSGRDFASDAQKPLLGRPEPEAAPDRIAPNTIETTRLAEGPPYEPYEREVIREREVVREVVVEQPPTVVLAPPPNEVNVSFFYEALSPYGSWVSVNEQWCWQPTVVSTDHGWRPYCDRGHWVNSDYGWAWQSDYSWGWAPFHYGRWSSHPQYGWIWSPDSVWAPAWVSWRSCDSHYGWAPLPPAARYEAGVGFHYQDKHVAVDFSFGLVERDYFFIPAERFCEPTLRSHRVDPTQVTNVYNNTTIIQNNYTYNDKRIINRGPAVDHVRKATRKEIKEYRIADADIKPGEQIRNGRIQNNELGFYRPKIDPVVPETPPAVVARQEAAARKREASRQASNARYQKQQENYVEQLAHRESQKASVELKRKQLNAEDEAKKQKDAVLAAEKTRVRLEKAADSERDEAKRIELRTAAAEQRKKAAEAQKLQRDAEQQVDAQKKAVEASEREQDRLSKARELANRNAGRKQELDANKQQNAAEIQADAAAREKARLDAAARQDALEQQRKDAAAVRKQQNTAEIQADAVAREKARLEAAARQDALEQQRKDAAAARK